MGPLMFLHITMAEAFPTKPDIHMVFHLYVDRWCWIRWELLLKLFTHSDIYGGVSLPCEFFHMDNKMGGCWSFSHILTTLVGLRLCASEESRRAATEASHQNICKVFLLSGSSGEFEDENYYWSFSNIQNICRFVPKGGFLSNKVGPVCSPDSIPSDWVVPPLFCTISLILRCYHSQRNHHIQFTSLGPCQQYFFCVFIPAFWAITSRPFWGSLLFICLGVTALNSFQNLSLLHLLQEWEQILLNIPLAPARGKKFWITVEERE